jgi:hypothetical protein
MSGHCVSSMTSNLIQKNVELYESVCVVAMRRCVVDSRSSVVQATITTALCLCC